MSKTDLNYLIQAMRPKLQPQSMVFVSCKADLASQHLNAACAMIRESEGVTLIVTRDYADEQQLAYEADYKMISLTVESSLEAVGLTAAFASALAEQQIPANVLAGYYHDHILVPKHLASKAMSVLTNLASQQT